MSAILALPKNNYDILHGHIAIGDDESVLHYAQQAPENVAIWNSPPFPYILTDDETIEPTAPIFNVKTIIADFLQTAQQVLGNANMSNHTRNDRTYTKWSLNELPSYIDRNNCNPIFQAMYFLSDAYAQTQGCPVSTFRVFTGERFSTHWHIDQICDLEKEHHKIALWCLHGAGTDILPIPFTKTGAIRHLKNPDNYEDTFNAAAALCRHQGDVSTLSLMEKKALLENAALCTNQNEIIGVPERSIAVISASTDPEVCTIHRSPLLAKQSRQRIVILALPHE